ncbi:hypothetical protein [Frankia tisae]|uniref:hypothetical protein n=1 Tax=Frankia tisae TaxID=2950104 RepID=UPI0021BE88CA|nr:hypothetical protein [Frankia tisae]
MPATPVADPPLDDVPDQLHAQAMKLITEHRARTRRYRDTLLRPGGPDLKPVTFGDGTRSRGPAATEALAAANRWWEETITFASQLLDLDRDHADALARIVADELSQVLRARTIVLAEVAADVVGSQAAAGPLVNDDGTVNVAGTRVPLSGIVAAGPPRREPEVRVVVEPGGDPAVVAERLRSIAAEIELSGHY